ncbi:hypothetical protein [Actinomadura opuntiae]|uniref:hypothetical protein n=1 Tax=Actinomadura sp. OS1-43 TaxID=604315 RepID=UPI00255A9FA7|nr:hypothetical protein [Actinomadura sp. OS1-43]MDL4815491.1 hypothetical protein [Actinomadura sp. OS1-43]
MTEEMQEPSDHAFQVTYEVDETRHARVRVKLGFASMLDVDYQSVTVEDPRLPFRVEGEVRDGRLIHLRYAARPKIGVEELDRILWRVVDAVREDKPTPEVPQGDGITQKLIKAVPAVSIIKRWAAVGHEFQEALRRYAQGLGEEIIPEMVQSAPPELLDDLARLHASQEDALRSTLETLTNFHTSQTGQRARGEEAEELLNRVVAEYKDAVARGVRAPRAVVAERLKYHPAHVGRLLGKARERGMLPPAKPRGRRKTEQQLRDEER